MSHALKGKIALVTGAASGIGASTVERFLEEGVKHVAVLDIAEELGLALRNELNTKYKEDKVSFIKCDVTDKGSLIDAFETVKTKNGSLDVVINNAGVLDEESQEMTVNINLTALITSSLEAWNIMHKEKGGFGGTIINFSSIAAISQFVFLPIYSATKSAVLKFSTCLGNDLVYSGSGVRVITVCFGVTLTPILRNITKTFDKSLEPLASIADIKMQSPESAAKAVVEAYKQGASGSVWLSTSDKPALDITKEHDGGIELFHNYVYA